MFSDEDGNELLYLEDYHAEFDDIFVNEELRPYFLGVFADFALRSTPSTSSSSQPGKSIDKVTFTEYINLPGIVSDRFFALAKKGRSDNRVSEEAFLNSFLAVFGSSLEQKMQFVF